MANAADQDNDVGRKWHRLPTLLARVMSNRVVTVCFLGPAIAEEAAGVGEFSSEKVSSRSLKLNAVDENASFHTVYVTFEASTLFQKKGLSRLVGRTILDFPNLKALGGGGGPGGGGMPSGGGGGGAADNEERTGESGDGKDNAGPMKAGGGGGGGGGEGESFSFMGRTGGGGGGGGGGGDVWASGIEF